ncbi:MAG: Gfo/Idh/MocA family oxidoreductase, partial [Candidatus Aenigmatarchaeota archaeon]
MISDSGRKSDCMTFNFGIIGCGLVGNKRANALKEIPKARLVKVADKNIEKAKETASKHNCSFTDDREELIRDEDIDVLIVSTTNDSLAEITVSGLKNGKHVLVEKPAGRNPEEIEK